MVEVVGLGRGRSVPDGVLVPAEFQALFRVGGYGTLEDGMRIGLIGGPEPGDPSLRRLEDEASGRGLALRVVWGEPLRHALSLPSGRTLFGAAPMQAGDLLFPGAGPFEPRRHALFDPEEEILIFGDVRREGERVRVGDAAGRVLTPLAAAGRHPSGYAGALERLIAIMAALRGPTGCPWDREQDHLTLRRYILEEAAETVDAIEDGDAGKVRDELGDLLLQVVFQARLFEEEGTFGFADVADGLAEKLLRRHPHVFGEGRARHASDVERLWQEVKAREGDGEARGLLASVPRSLPVFERLCDMLRLTSEMGIDPAGLPMRGVGIVAEVKRMVEGGLEPAMAVRDAVVLLEAGLAAVDEAARQDGGNARKWSRARVKTAFFLGIEAKLAGKKKD